MTAADTAQPPGTPEVAPARPQKLGRQAITSSFWAIGGHTTGQVIRFGGHLIVARLLSPSAFGLVQIVNVVLQGLKMFSDVGVGPSIIQHRRGDDKAFLDTAWTIQVMRGTALTVGATLLAWPLAHMYGQPVYLIMVPVAALSGLIQGFISTGPNTLHRHMKIRQLNIYDLSVQIVTVSATLIAAIVIRNYWALIIGPIIGALFRLFVSHVILMRGKPKNWFRWERMPAAT